MIRAIIFDFDGLILDTEMPDFRAWQELFEEHGVGLVLEEWVVCLGTTLEVFSPFAELEKKLGCPVDRDALWIKHNKRRLELILLENILPGVEDYLAAARRLGLKIGLASTSSCDWVEGHLTRLGLIQYFDAIRCADWVENVKPAPDLYLAALEALGIDADEAVALEDSPNGITAARRAGVFAVAVPNAVSRTLDLSHADLMLDSLTSTPLERLIARVQNNHN
jgi:HAD superfamily hydrolase (TIGR01509 family)